MKSNQLKALHTSVLAVFAAFQTTVKVGREDYTAMVKLLRSAPLNDAECIKAMRDDLLATFGEAHKDAAQIRINIVHNARRVAFGGVKDDVTVRGKGTAAMLQVVGSVDSIRELRKALADAVPVGLKSEGYGGKRKGKSAKKADSTPDALKVPKVTTREQAFAAARKVLEFVRDKFTKPSETDLTEKINACVAEFTK